MSAAIIDGKAFAAGLRARVAERRRRAGGGARRRPGPRRGAGRRGPGEPGLRPQQGRGRPSRPGCARSSTACRRDDAPRPSCSALVARAQRRSGGPRHPRPAAAAAADRRRPRARGDRAGQGRRRLPPGQRRAAGDRAAGDGALHAARLPDAAARRSSATSAGCDAVVVGRSNIVGKPMAQLLLRESCTVTIAHSRTRDLRRRRAAAPTSSSPPSAGRRWSRATGSSRARR